MDEEMKASLQKLHHSWTFHEFAGELDKSSQDWQLPILASMKEGDVMAMAESAAPMMEAVLIQTALDPKAPPPTRVDAAKTVLSQTGKGPLQKIQTTLAYEAMGEDQIKALLRSRLLKVAKSNPKLLEDVIPAEFTEEVEDLIGEGVVESESVIP